MDEEKYNKTVILTPCGYKNAATIKTTEIHLPCLKLEVCGRAGEITRIPLRFSFVVFLFYIRKYS